MKLPAVVRLGMHIYPVALVASPLSRAFIAWHRPEGACTASHVVKRPPNYSHVHPTVRDSDHLIPGGSLLAVHLEVCSTTFVRNGMVALANVYVGTSSRSPRGDARY
jgi:hypothetical protein